jgi:hypothetical protein
MPQLPVRVSIMTRGSSSHRSMATIEHIFKLRESCVSMQVFKAISLPSCEDNME